MTNTPHIMDFQRVVFFTGAGMSAESGVPTFRGRGGMWAQYKPDEIACQKAFLEQPEKVWAFHNWRREIVAACEPNAGHKLITACQAQHKDITIITQNIDGLHQAAGSDKVVELHGSLWRLRDEATGEIVENFQAPLENLRTPSGGYWRPDIVWFGDMLNEQNIHKAITAIERCDLLVSIGTSAMVYPAARLPLLGQEVGATMVEINPEPTLLSEIFPHQMRETATTALAKLCDGLQG